VSPYLNNLFKLPAIYSRFLRNLKQQKKFLQTTICLDIEQAKKNNDSNSNESDFKKITSYYGNAVPAVLGEAYCELRGVKMSANERMALSYLGGSTGLFDDFFDKDKLPDSYIKSLIDDPFTAKGNNTKEKLFLKFYRIALENSRNPELVKEYSFKVMEAQIGSRKQTQPTIETEEIKEITFFKGGISLLFFRSALNDVPNQKESDLIYKAGSLIQLENDIFDIYKDQVDNIKTLATTATNIHKLRTIYKTLFHEVIDLLKQSDFENRNKNIFLMMLTSLVSRGFVCLDVLEKNEKLTNGVFEIKNYTRGQLICDMEKPVNFLKQFNYFAKFNDEVN
jgi:hypothetical protein